MKIERAFKLPVGLPRGVPSIRGEAQCSGARTVCVVFVWAACGGLLRVQASAAALRERKVHRGAIFSQKSVSRGGGEPLKLAMYIYG